MELVDNVTMWETALPMLLTLILTLMPTFWSGRTKRYVAAAAAVVVTVVDLYIRGSLDPSNLVGLFLLIFLGSQGVFLLFEERLKGLAQATDLS